MVSFLLWFLVTCIAGVKFRWRHFSRRRNIIEWSLWRFNKSTMWFRSIRTFAINASGMVFAGYPKGWRRSLAAGQRRRGKFWLWYTNHRFLLNFPIIQAQKRPLSIFLRSGHTYGHVRCCSTPFLLEHNFSSSFINSFSQLFEIRDSHVV